MPTTTALTNAQVVALRAIRIATICRRPSISARTTSPLGLYDGQRPMRVAAGALRGLARRGLAVEADGTWQLTADGEAAAKANRAWC